MTSPQAPRKGSLQEAAPGRSKGLTRRQAGSLPTVLLAVPARRPAAWVAEAGRLRLEVCPAAAEPVSGAATRVAAASHSAASACRAGLPQTAAAARTAGLLQVAGLQLLLSAAPACRAGTVLTAAAARTAGPLRPAGVPRVAGTPRQLEAELQSYSAAAEQSTAAVPAVVRGCLAGPLLSAESVVRRVPEHLAVWRPARRRTLSSRLRPACLQHHTMIRRKMPYSWAMSAARVAGNSAQMGVFTHDKHGSWIMKTAPERRTCVDQNRGAVDVVYGGDVGGRGEGGLRDKRSVRRRRVHRELQLRRPWSPAEHDSWEL